MKLEGKIAVITGASAGMGKAMVLLFAKEGATVIAIARRKERLDEIVLQAKDFDGKIIAVQGDVAVEKDMEDLIDRVVKEYGTLDILINNAGIMDEMMPVAEVTDELWNRVIDVNLTGPFVLCRKAVQQMEKQGQGNIINIASAGGLRGARAGAAYTASKFGLVGLTKNIGYMYATKGIRCNAICPGGVDTEIGAAGVTHPSQFGLERAMSGMGTNPRSGSPDELANVALFLASDDSSFVNGTTITVDGGWTAY
ncbi:SDR family oxidoreductase [Muricomes intestini]|jgi:NAD(P)-dependent dehydrogenase (short-subunit alcohol dehydrogenase family)|uniref:SDR family oxidoreductase n=1 Tax=Muricomes intestini TaxID=1796634 RepID=UPI000E99B6CD|nr:3-ketoacyl-ACP reductase [Lachnospiraceae bacterium]